MDKVREYINFTFENLVDREIIVYLWDIVPVTGPAAASQIYNGIPHCNRPTFDKRLKLLFDSEKIARKKPDSFNARYCPPFLYYLRRDTLNNLKDVEGIAFYIRRIRIDRQLGRTAPSDEEIVNWFLAREERGIFVPHHLNPPANLTFEDVSKMEEAELRRSAENEKEDPTPRRHPDMPAPGPKNGKDLDPLQPIVSEE